MVKRITSASKNRLLTTPLPQQTKSYTVISHGFVIDVIEEELAKNGFEINSESYKSVKGGDVAHGAFHINYADDPELDMVYSFTNSYDKTLRFTAAVGAKILLNDNYILTDSDHWNRVHKGSALTETENAIRNHIQNAKTYFDQVISTRNKMKALAIDRKRFGQIVCELFFENLIGIEQVSTIFKEYLNPSFQYPEDNTNLWTCYNHILHSLKNSHPTKWMKNQIGVHLYLCIEFDLIDFDAEPTKLDGVDAYPIISEDCSSFPILPGFTPEYVEEKRKEKEQEIKETGPHQVTLEELIDRNLNEKVDETINEMKDGLIDPSIEDVITPIVQTPEQKETAPVYFACDDFPHIKKDDYFETDDKTYKCIEVNEKEGVITTVLITEGTNEEESSKMNDDDIYPLHQETLNETVDDEQLIETPIIETVVELVVKPVVETIIKPTVKDPVYDKLVAKLEDIYGTPIDFKYTVNGELYNILMDTGETVSLTKTFIESNL